ncbi:hypothetical protein IAU60_002107 [Kwoniella sp. DSM 27419]
MSWPSSPVSWRILPRRRNLTLLLVITSVLFCLATFHPSSGLEPSQRIDRLKNWSADKTSDFIDVLPEEGWGATFKGWWSQRPTEPRQCHGWDPSMPEEQDPVGCLKARQYRQTMRVLAREELGKHDHWYFTRPHNIETLRNISRCFLPVSDPAYTKCPEKPLIVSGWWYTAEVITGGTSGETIWQTSIMKLLKTMGYGFVAMGPYGNWNTAAEMMPDVYYTLWNNNLDVVSCVTDPRCVAKDHYVPPVGAEDLSIGVPDEERGVIPIWQLNVVDYWGSKPLEHSSNQYYWGLTEHGEWSYQPLGQAWIATPWPLPGDHFHLAYTMEDYCLDMPTTPHAERRNAALLLAKRSIYFDQPGMSPKAFWTNISRDHPYDLLVTARVEKGHPLPDGLETMGFMKRPEYEALVGDVKVMVGMGKPAISPSVYVALCQGTPLVLPIFDPSVELTGWARFGGTAQHGPVMALGEPYVYAYDNKNYTQLEQAIEKAMATEIERYIPDDMRLSFAKSQLRKYMARDLESMFHQVVRANGGKIPALIKGARERCYEHKRCHHPMPAGRVPGTSMEPSWAKKLSDLEKLNAQG